MSVADVELVGPISNVETIAIGRGIHELANLRKLLGKGKRRKLKGVANVRLPSGNVRSCEIHWDETHGIGKRKVKIKRFRD